MYNSPQMVCPACNNPTLLLLSKNWYNFWNVFNKQCITSLTRHSCDPNCARIYAHLLNCGNDMFLESLTQRVSEQSLYDGMLMYLQFLNLLGDKLESLLDCRWTIIRFMEHLITKSIKTNSHKQKLEKHLNEFKENTSSVDVEEGDVVENARTMVIDVVLKNASVAGIPFDG
jgi:hypothetical protein